MAKKSPLQTLDRLGIDPIESLARIARQAEAEDDKRLAVKCYSELAQYIAPKLKSVEVSGFVDHNVMITSEQRQTRIRVLAESMGMQLIAPQVDAEETTM